MVDLSRSSDKYFNFLIEQVDLPDYQQLLIHLYDICFYSSIPMDDNRIDDSLHLREIFYNERGYIALPVSQNRPCSVLEVLIGLAYRMENELDSGPVSKNMSECFYILLQNLKIDCFDDEKYDFDEVENKIYNFIDRKYMANGEGGLFPLKICYEDQRKVEIWYQMSAWLLENFEW